MFQKNGTILKPCFVPACDCLPLLGRPRTSCKNFYSSTTIVEIMVAATEPTDLDQATYHWYQCSESAQCCVAGSPCMETFAHTRIGRPPDATVPVAWHSQSHGDSSPSLIPNTELWNEKPRSINFESRSSNVAKLLSLQSATFRSPFHVRHKTKAKQNPKKNTSIKSKLTNIHSFVIVMMHPSICSRRGSTIAARVGRGGTSSTLLPAL